MSTEARILARARRRFLARMPWISKADAAALARHYLAAVNANNGRTT